MDIDKYIHAHQYKLDRVSAEEKEFVLTAKRNAVNMAEFNHLLNGEKSLLVLKYPGIFYTDYNFFGDYLLNVYESYQDVFTPPRGLVDKSSVIVVGINPGWSTKSFGESNWLYGPSSQRLHYLLDFEWHWYFTNIAKEPFEDNTYNEDIVRKYLPLFLEEAKFFEGQKFIFLGKYDVYGKAISKFKLNHIKIRHPSYFLYKSQKDLELEKIRVIEFVKR